METGNIRAGASLLNHARELAATAPLCGIPTADEDVARHCIAQGIGALQKRGLSAKYFLEETDYLWDVFTNCRRRVEAGYDESKGTIGNYAWKCARSAANETIPKHDMRKLYGSNANIYAPEVERGGGVGNYWSWTYEAAMVRDERGQICEGTPDEEAALEELDVEAVIGILDERAQTIIRRYYLDKLVLREIAELVGVSAQRVNLIRHQALEKMRLFMTRGEA